MSITEILFIISILLSLVLYYAIKIGESAFKKNIMKYVILLLIIISVIAYAFTYLSNYDGCGGFSFIFIFLEAVLLLIFSFIEKLYKKPKV